MRKRIGGWLLAIGIWLLPGVAFAQGQYMQQEVVPQTGYLPGPLGHPRYEDGGFFVAMEFLYGTQTNPIRINNAVKLNNDPVNKVQVQNNQQNNRPQLNATTRMVNNGGNNFRQSMNQAPAMGSGNNQRGFMH